MQSCDLKNYQYVADHEYERSRISKCMRYDQKKKDWNLRNNTKISSRKTGCIVVFEEIVSVDF